VAEHSLHYDSLHALPIGGTIFSLQWFILGLANVEMFSQRVQDVSAAGEKILR
jgi:hypothetical protein